MMTERFHLKNENKAIQNGFVVKELRPADLSMVDFPYKKIVAAKYYFNNLPKTLPVTGGGTIKFTYNASGTKLRKEVLNTSSVPILKQDYVGKIEYKDGIVEAIYTSEGRAVWVAASSSWRYEYNITDHLGNVRAVISDINNNGILDVASGEIINQNAYYPFGLQMNNPALANNTTTPDTKYQYNGKEFNGDHGLAWSDYGARWYDAAIGRFKTSDPLSDIAPGWTPYRYGFNNPMTFIDPTGMAEESAGAQATHNQMMMQNKARTEAAGRNEMWEKGGNGAPDIGDSSSESASEESSSSSESSGSDDSTSGCGGPGEPPCVNQPATILQSFVPWYGSYLDMIYSWENGDYFRSAGNGLLFATDFALVKSLFMGLGKATFKGAAKGFAKSGVTGALTYGPKRYFGIGMSHTWGATTARWSSLGVGGGVKHHWLLTQSMMEKYTWLKPIGNQAWNITTFSSQASHMRWAHFTAFPSLDMAAIPGARLLYPITSTPMWLKLGAATGLIDSSTH